MPPEQLELNDIGRVRLRTSAPLAFDPYVAQPPHRQLHPDRRGHATAPSGAGMITAAGD